MNMCEAIRHTLQLKMAEDDRICLLGEDVGKMGGVFRVSVGLQDAYSQDRVVDTPLSETALVGAAIGMAVYGLRPVIEIQFMDFIYPAADQIINELAKLRFRSGGQFSAPVVIRSPYGGGIRGGLYHSQSCETVFLHVPGIKVVVPSTPADAKGLLTSALEDSDPVLYLEPKRLYRLFRQPVPLGPFRIPLGKATVLRPGSDVTMITYGAMARVGLEAADLAEGAGLDCEVIDLRTLNPWDESMVLEAVARTRRAAVIHEAPEHCGFGAEISARITEELFATLQAPVLRIAGYDTPYPYALEKLYYPGAQRVFQNVARAFGPSAPP
ncbi:MAG: alpha-ketoacid dehydrogenase subunit beta [Acidobacteriia bacterium]|nr:alpha-ketoacid dehydrogenase subunit beta [Terriglobia bacterium]